MDVKDRVIRLSREHHSFRQADCIIVAEYGIEKEAIYHRNITISEDIFEAFKKNPDSEIHFDEFLQCNDINSEWERYKLSVSLEENRIENSSSLLADIEQGTLRRSTE